MRFHGSTEVEKVLETMEYACYVLDAQHIVLDNLQFMMGSAGSSRGYGGKYDAQERALEAIRRFATDNNVHVTIVIHPRKEQDGATLSLNSVFGTAKATQEVRRRGGYGGGMGGKGGGGGRYL